MRYRKKKDLRTVRFGPEHGRAMSILFTHFPGKKDFTLSQAEAAGVSRDRLEELVAFQYVSHYPVTGVYSTHVVRNTSIRTVVQVSTDTQQKILKKDAWLIALKARKKKRKK